MLKHESLGIDFLCLIFNEELAYNFMSVLVVLLIMNTTFGIQYSMLIKLEFVKTYSSDSGQR